jgi:hypothetical protein
LRATDAAIQADRVHLRVFLSERIAVGHQTLARWLFEYAPPALAGLGDSRSQHDTQSFARKLRQPGLHLQRNAVSGTTPATAHLSGMTIFLSAVSTTKMASSLAGSVSDALWLTW